jgi:hypothetical protein
MRYTNWQLLWAVETKLVKIRATAGDYITSPLLLSFLGEQDVTLDLSALIDLGWIEYRSPRGWIVTKKGKALL